MSSFRISNKNWAISLIKSQHVNLILNDSSQLTSFLSLNWAKWTFLTIWCGKMLRPVGCLGPPWWWWWWGWWCKFKFANGLPSIFGFSSWLSPELESPSGEPRPVWLFFPLPSSDLKWMIIVIIPSVWHSCHSLSKSEGVEGFTYQKSDGLSSLSVSNRVHDFVFGSNWDVIRVSWVRKWKSGFFLNYFPKIKIEKTCHFEWRVRDGHNFNGDALMHCF